MDSEENKQRIEEAFQAIQAQRQSQMGWLQRRFGCFGNLIGWIIVFIALSGVYIFFDALSSPWAYTFFGTRPTLVGEWTGAFTLPNGQRGLIHLNLWHPYAGPNGLKSVFREIDGAGQSCIQSSRVQTYEVYGEPNTSGSDVPLGLRIQPPFVPGYIIQDMRGSWIGDTLTLTGLLNQITDTSGSTEVNPNDVNQSRDITISFRKGSLQDFITACGYFSP